MRAPSTPSSRAAAAIRAAPQGSRNEASSDTFYQTVRPRKCPMSDLRDARYWRESAEEVAREAEQICAPSPTLHARHRKDVRPPRERADNGPRAAGSRTAGLAPGGGHGSSGMAAAPRGPCMRRRTRRVHAACDSRASPALPVACISANTLMHNAVDHVRRLSQARLSS